MATLCPTSQPCCPGVCLAVAPAAAQGSVVEPPQMLWMAPLPFVGMAHASSLDFSGLTYVAPGDAMWTLPALTRLQDMPEADWSVVPTQASMHEQPWYTHSSVHDGHSAPKERQVETSRSVLRRRRRQRAAARLPEEATQPQPTPDSSGDGDALATQQLTDSLLAQLRGGADEKRLAAAQFRSLAFEGKVQSRAAQLAVEKAQGGDKALLASGLHGHVVEAMRSMYANYVLQKIVEVLPAAHTGFVARELLGHGAEAVRHRFGCRILCRLLEHSSSADSSTALLFEEVLTDAARLCRHAFGNYVVRHFLEYGLPQHQHMVARALCADLFGNAQNEFGSRVIEAALQFCQAEDRRFIAAEILSAGSDQLRVLAEGQCSCHVVKELLRLPDEFGQQAINFLRPAEQQLRSSKYGKHVWNVVESVVGRS